MEVVVQFFLYNRKFSLRACLTALNNLILCYLCWFMEDRLSQMYRFVKFAIASPILTCFIQFIFRLLEGRSCTQVPTSWRCWLDILAECSRPFSYIRTIFSPKHGSSSHHLLYHSTLILPLQNVKKAVWVSNDFAPYSFRGEMQFRINFSPGFPNWCWRWLVENPIHY